MELLRVVNEYRQLFESGDNLALIERFYAEDIIQVENNETPVKGKQALLGLEEKIMGGVNWFTQKISSLVIDEEQAIVMGEMDISFESKKHGKKKLKEAFVQNWLDGKIVYQKFYYKEIVADNE